MKRRLAYWFLGCLLFLWLVDCSNTTGRSPTPNDRNACSPGLPSVASHPDWKTFAKQLQQTKQSGLACLQMVWLNAGKSQGSSTLPVLLNERGQLSSTTGTSNPFQTLSLPSKPEGYIYRFRVFVAPPEMLKDEQQRLCNTAMTTPAYDCTLDGNRNQCLFYYELRLSNELFSGQTQVIDGDPNLVCQVYWRESSGKLNKEEPLVSEVAENADASENVVPESSETSPEVPETPEIGVEAPPEKGPCVPTKDKPCPWWVGGGGHEQDRFLDMVVAPNGDVYVVGASIAENLAFDPSFSFTRKRALVGIVGKLNAKGEWLWIKVLGEEVATNAVWGVALDKQGNLYIAGNYKKSMSLGKHRLEVTPPSGHVYVAKLSPSEEWEWVATGTCKSGTTCEFLLGSLVVSPEGNIYIAGYSNHDIVFGKVAYNTKGVGHSFVAALSSSGEWLWVKGFFTDIQHTRDYRRVPRLTLSSEGHITVTGLVIRQTSIGAFSLQVWGRGDIFVAQLSSKGKWLWAVTAGGNGIEGAPYIVKDSKGDFYIGGTLGTANVHFFGAFRIQSYGSYTGFLAKLSAAGKWQKVIRIGQGSDWATVLRIAIDPKDNLYVVGHFSKTMKIASFSLKSKLERAHFVTKISGFRTWEWAVAGGGYLKRSSNWRNEASIAVLPNGSWFMAGSTLIPSFGKYSFPLKPNFAKELFFVGYDLQR